VKTKRALVAAMMTAAVLAALVRLRLGNIDLGVVVQCVFSFFAVAAASVTPPRRTWSAERGADGVSSRGRRGAEPTDREDRIARMLRVATLLAFAGALLVSPYLRVAYFAPLVAASLVLFGAWLAAERYGRKMLFALVLLAPVVVWGAHELRIALEHRRVRRLVSTQIERIVLVSPDGATTRELRDAAIDPIVARFAEMDALDAERTQLTDAWRGEIVLRSGQRDSLIIGRHERGRMATWIGIGDLDYVVYEPYEVVIADATRPH
jgi:hypothetical protein